MESLQLPISPALTTPSLNLNSRYLLAPLPGTLLFSVLCWTNQLLLYEPAHRENVEPPCHPMPRPCRTMSHSPVMTAPTVTSPNIIIGHVLSSHVMQDNTLGPYSRTPCKLLPHSSRSVGPPMQLRGGSRSPYGPLQGKSGSAAHSHPYYVM